ncbi:MAG: Gfo/Idh/MocA family oxidoreductase [Chloroflexi bacterium]|nr:Gfo/Idh/MocA family oxidoreductase [Chloroflexota bacterium]
MNRVGIGVLSHAHGHADTYCRTMREFDDVDLIATWDDNVERGERAALAFGMEYRSSADAVIEDPRIHAVIIAMETNRHVEFIERAAAAGKHILCQKPMATTSEDCDRIIAAVDRHGVKFSMAFQMRQDPVNRRIKELLDAGAVGQVAIVRRRHAISVLLNPEFVHGPSRWHLDPEANVGMFFDDATHAADWFYWLLGAPRSVFAEVDQVVTHESPDDNGVAVYRFSRGEIGILLNSSTTVAAVSTTEIYGDEGTIIQDYGDGPATAAPRPSDAVPLRLFRRGDSEWTEFPLPIPSSQADRIAAVPRPFIDYVRGLTDETVSAEEGKVSVEMVLAAYRSAEEGRRVELPLSRDSLRGGG